MGAKEDAVTDNDLVAVEDASLDKRAARLEAKRYNMVLLLLDYFFFLLVTLCEVLLYQLQ